MAGDMEHPTYLEQAFDFEDLALRAYIQTEEITYPQLVDTLKGLNDHPEPAAQFACGWAWAERTMQRLNPRGDKRDTWEARSNHLAMATAHWQHAIEGLNEVPSDSPYKKMPGKLLGIHIQQAIVHNQQLTLAARRRCRLPITEEGVQTAQDITERHTLKMGEQVMRWRAATHAEREVKEWLVGKMICGLLAQSSRYMVIPAPVRRLYNEDAARHLDYFAVPVEPPYLRIPIEVLLENQPYYEHGKYAMVVDARQELVLSRATSLFRTFDVLQRALERGDAPDKSMTALIDISQSLMERLDRQRGVLQSHMKQATNPN
jgi:hypothetical protein